MGAENLTLIPSITPKFLRQHPDLARECYEKRGATELFDRFLELDEKKRELEAERDRLRSTQKQLSQEIAKGERQPGPQLKELSRGLKSLETEVGELNQRFEDTYAQLPNLPDPETPVEDQVIREVGDNLKTGEEHLELVGEHIGMEAGAKTSGSRFTYLKGPLVRTQLALYNYVLDKLEGQGFTPVIPPVLVREEALRGTGFFPDSEGQVYAVERDELYLVGTSEVPLASLHQDEILKGEDLPIRYAGLSTCFRREAGAAGRDTKGLFRTHQFDKVEMFSFVRPEDSRNEHLRILAIQEEILTELNIPYRVVNIAAHELGNSASIKYDCEAWLPGQERYRELTSCSNTTDYQSYRLKIRYKDNPTDQARYLHTLNGTAVAIGRTLIALIENGQQEGGEVRLPEILTSYGAPGSLA